MSRFWDILSKLIERPIRRTACGRFIIPCATCKADVILPEDHWAYPSHMEDMQTWECPPCVNKARAVQGLEPLRGRKRPSA